MKIINSEHEKGVATHQIKLSSRAFTLIELLVVVLIIGILAAVAVPQYQKAVEKSRLSEALLNISIMQKQLDLYVLENGYPTGYTREHMVFYIDIANVEIPGKVINAEEGEFETSYFYYSGSGSSEGCSASASRKDDAHYYQLVTFRENDEQSWTKLCCDCGTKTGKYICESLTSQGWTHKQGEY